MVQVVAAVAGPRHGVGVGVVCGRCGGCSGVWAVAVKVVERETRDGSCKVDNGKCGNGSGFDGGRDSGCGVGDANVGGGASVSGCDSFEFAASG